MSIGAINHSSFISYLPEATENASLEDKYTTTAVDEEILFTENSEQRYLNSLLVENTGAAVMYLKILPYPFLAVIPANSSRSFEYLRMTGIQVRGAIGQTLRWHGFSY